MYVICTQKTPHEHLKMAPNASECFFQRYKLQITMVQLYKLPTCTTKFVGGKNLLKVDYSPVHYSCNRIIQNVRRLLVLQQKNHFPGGKV